MEYDNNTGRHRSVYLRVDISKISSLFCFCMRSLCNPFQPILEKKSMNLNHKSRIKSAAILHSWTKLWVSLRKARKMLIEALAIRQLPKDIFWKETKFHVADMLFDCLCFLWLEAPIFGSFLWFLLNKVCFLLVILGLWKIVRKRTYMIRKIIFLCFYIMKKGEQKNIKGKIK